MAMSIPPAKDKITFGKFQNVDMRVARVVAAPRAEGTKAQTRQLTLDLGEMGERTSVGQFALVAEEDLVGSHVVACINLGERPIGDLLSQALVLGTPHPDSPVDEDQAMPLRADPAARPGESVY
jgi:tRNA-binding protein